MELEFLKSASVIVKENNKTLLVDPWLVDGEYYGAWYHYPKFNFKNFLKRKIDYIYLSHIHPDHMSRETLKKLDKKITILIHKYAKPFLKFNLEKLGFKNIIELKHGEKFNLEKNFYIQIYAADDCNPSLCQKFFKCHFSAEKLGSQQIDTISLVSNGRKNILNVNDCPLELSAGVTDKIMKDVKQVDLLLTGYSGAGPFPQCFPHYSKEKKINLMKNKKEKFINQAYNYINTVKPKYYMPFAGTYFLGSNLYNLNEFRGVPTRYEAINSLNKKIKKSKNIKPLLLKTHGKFNLENYKVLNPLKKEEVKYDSKMKNYLKSKKLSYHFMKKPKKSEILRLMHIASKNFFEKIKIQKIFSKSLIGIYLNKKQYFLVDLNKKTTSIISKKNFKSLNYVILKTDLRLLYLILKGPRYAHWDNADIGSHLSYERKPDRYDRAINYALNFFHC